MVNGKMHDHPLTDILHYSHPIYGDEADNLIRKIARLCSQRELTEWWDREIGWSGNSELALQKSRLQLDALMRGAKESGWEMPE